MNAGPLWINKQTNKPTNKQTHCILNRHIFCLIEQFDIVCFHFIIRFRYVKVYLLPDQSRVGKRKTKTKHGTIDPEFNEEMLVRLFYISTLRTWRKQEGSNVFP